MIKNLYIAVLVSIFIVPVEGAYYRWTDDDGKTHYSYSVPAEKSQLGHVEISKQGIETKKVISQKRKRQLKELAELRRLHQVQLEKENKDKAVQHEEDSLLLSVFSTEDELIKAYDTKLQLAQVTIDLLKGRHKKQSEKLEVLEQRYERLVDIKHKQALEKQIDLVLDNLKIYQQAITENMIEKDKVKGEFKTTLLRFQKLMSKPKTELQLLEKNKTN